MTCTNPSHAPDPGRDGAMAAIAQRYRTGCPETAARWLGYAVPQPGGVALRGDCHAACGGTQWEHHVTWAQLDRFVAAPQMGLGI